MKLLHRALGAICAAGVIWWPLCTSRTAQADETRAYVRPVPEARGLVVAVADSSVAAQRALTTRVAPALARASGCAPGRVYWRRGGGPPPPCTSAQWVPTTSATATLGLRCAHVLDDLRSRGYAVVARLRQWDPAARQWGAPAPGARAALECREDSGLHGSESGAWYAADGDSRPWTRVSRAEIAWNEDAVAYTLYASAYVGAWAAPQRADSTAWDAERTALERLGAGGRHDLALLRHSWNGDGTADADAEGGMVVAAADARNGAFTDALRGISPGGGAPWTETLYEATRYLRGERVDFGRDAHAAPRVPLPSVPDSRATTDPSHYAEPWSHSCTRGRVLALVAGTPTHDASGRPNALSLPGFGGLERCTGGAEAPCLPALLEYLGTTDLSRLPGTQHAPVDWVPVNAEAPELEGSSATTRWALDPRDRADAAPLLVEWLARATYDARAPAVAGDATPRLASVATSPGVAVAAGFVPARDDRWRGAIAKLGRAADGSIAARDAFRPASPERRRLYTDLASGALTAPANAVHAGNAALTADALGLAPSESDRRARTLAWARGADTEDADADGDRTESRDELGAVVGGSLAIVPHAAGVRVYAGTGDGVLHSFDASGAEHWAFVPAVFLPHLDELRLERASGTRHAGLDAELATLVVDADGDGAVSPGTGDRAVLYFGLRRGGRAYLALDVTDPDAPRRLWTLTPRDLPALAQTWATPVPARLTVAGVRQNAERRVVLLAGGHDPSQDVPRARDRDRIGAALYLVDAYTGTLLWHASGRAADAPDLVVADLEHAIAATPRALDVDEDGELDRAYVADTGGRLFRFDFRRGAGRGALASATLLATLGGAGSDDRRFYAEPDVALVRPPRARPYLAITLGSGFAPDPNAHHAADRLYSVRDALGPATQRAPLTDASLPDAASSALAAEAPGWKYALTSPGEKIVAGARTIDHRVYVPAYAPPALDLGADCTAHVGTSRLYAFDVRDARRIATRASPDTSSAESAIGPDAESAGVAPAIAVVALAARDCTGDCPREVVALFGTERVDVRWPGRIVRTGFAERGVE